MTLMTLRCSSYPIHVSLLYNTMTGVPASDAVIGVMDSSSALLNSGVAELTRDLIDKYPRRDDFHELLLFLLYETFIMGNQVCVCISLHGLTC